MYCSALNESGKIHLGFALGKALHDIGEYDNAFSAYTQANISRRKELTYDSDEFNRMVLAFKNDFNPKLIKSFVGSFYRIIKIYIYMERFRKVFDVIQVVTYQHSCRDLIRFILYLIFLCKYNKICKKK